MLGRIEIAILLVEFAHVDMLGTLDRIRRAFVRIPDVKQRPAIFATFQCEELSDGTRWLRADLSIDCASTVHIGFSMYAALMILVYPIGTPAFYYVLLRRSRASLNQLQASHLSAYSFSSYIGLGNPTLT